MDVTIFWEDTRILTTIKDSSGTRQINTKSTKEVTQTVLQNAETYFDGNVDVLGTEYIACYIPLFQENTKQPVGMVFLGQPRVAVSNVVAEIQWQMLFTIAAVLVVTGIIVIILVKQLVHGLLKSMHLLQQIANGDLTVSIDEKLLNRSDKVGMLVNEILQLQGKLQTIVDILRQKSSQLDLASVSLNKHSDSILQSMKGLDQSAQEMATSCSDQASDASTAGGNAVQMGDMIEDSSSEIHKMYDISNQIQEMSKQTMDEIEELNKDMKNVRTSIDDLAQQTELTKESADKISTATDLIAAVASQTSLLSLNASIEAVRAGDLGQGFGVVAAEIQKLSVQANEAVDDIRSMVESLIENSNYTIHRMEEVQVVITNQEKNVINTAQVFEHVRNEIKQSVSHMDSLIEKAKCMEDVRTEVVASVQNSAALAQENAASIEEAMAVLESTYAEIQILTERTQELETLSLQMKESVGMFIMQNTSS